MESPKTRSPLKYKPLRLPEQSVQDDLDDLLLNTLMPFVLAVIFLGVLAGMEWLAVLRHTPRQPWLYTGMTAIAAGALGWQFQRVRRRAAQLRLGRDGERSVGQFLEGLREEGARVFHEVPGDRFNLDYVVLSAKGFYVIETKTRTKPASGHARVSLTTDSILVGRFKPERDPIDQVQAGAR